MHGFLNNLDAGERPVARLSILHFSVGSGGVPWPGWRGFDNPARSTEAPLRALNLFKAIPDVRGRG